MTDNLNIHQRLAAAMGEVTYIQKEAKKGMNYTIVSHDVVTAKVRPVLLKHGIVYYPVGMQHANNGNRAEVVLTVRFVNIDEPTDFFDVPSLGYGIDPQDKGPGKAISYAVKYALLKAMGLETGDDADHDNIDHVDREAEAKQAAAAAKTKAFVDDIVSQIEPETPEGAAVILQENDAKLAWVKGKFPDEFKRVEDAAKAAGAPMRDVA